MSRLLGLAFVGALIFGDTAFSSPPQADDTMYIETKRQRDTHFITAVTRLTTCKITGDTDFRDLVPLYPSDSRKHEQGKVIMQFVIDSDSCVRKATILQSSGYYRLDKASLEFAKNLKFSPSMLSKIKSFDDGRPTFAFPIEWKLIPSVPYVPGDRCFEELEAHPDDVDAKKPRRRGQFPTHAPTPNHNLNRRFSDQFTYREATPGVIRADVN